MLLFGICAGAAWLLLNLLVLAACRVMSRADELRPSLVATACPFVHRDRRRRTSVGGTPVGSGLAGDRRPPPCRGDSWRSPSPSPAHARPRARQRLS